MESDNFAHNSGDKISEQIWLLPNFAK